MQHQSGLYNYCVRSCTTRKPAPWSQRSCLVTLAIRGWPNARGGAGGQIKTTPQAAPSPNYYPGNVVTDIIQKHVEFWSDPVRQPTKLKILRKLFCLAARTTGRPEGRTQDGLVRRSCGERATSPTGQGSASNLAQPTAGTQTLAGTTLRHTESVLLQV